MAAWVREEENASNQRQKKREAEEADKVEVAPGVTVASLRRFRRLGQPKDSLSDVDCAVSETETLRVRNVVDATRYAFFLGGGAWLRAGEGIGWLAAGTMPNSLCRMPLVYLFLTCVFCYSCSFLFVVFFFLCVCVFFCSHWSLVDVPLIFFCPADHVPDWQPRVLLGMVEARSVNVKKATTTTTLSSLWPIYCTLKSLVHPSIFYI